MRGFFVRGTRSCSTATGWVGARTSGTAAGHGPVLAFRYFLLRMESMVSKLIEAAALVLTIGLSAGVAHANEEVAVADPNQWLEGVEDPKALEWVKAQNAKAEAELASTPGFKQLEADLLAIYDSDDKIPGVYKQGQ